MPTLKTTWQEINALKEKLEKQQKESSIIFYPHVLQIIKSANKCFTCGDMTNNKYCDVACQMSAK